MELLLLDFECFASIGVNTPETIFQSSASESLNFPEPELLTQLADQFCGPFEFEPAIAVVLKRCSLAKCPLNMRGQEYLARILSRLGAPFS